jgi:hypothetical protein
LKYIFVMLGDCLDFESEQEDAVVTVRDFHERIIVEDGTETVSITEESNDLLDTALSAFRVCR